MKLFEIIRNCILSLIIFSRSFPIVFNKMIGQKDLGELYDTLLGLEMTTVIDVLKWDGQCPRLIQALAISINLIIHSLFLMIFLMWLQDNLSGPEADNVSMVSISFFFENGSYILMFLSGISSNSWTLTLWDCAELKESWRASHRLSNLIHS